MLPGAVDQAERLYAEGTRGASARGISKMAETGEGVQKKAPRERGAVVERRIYE